MASAGEGGHPRSGGQGQGQGQLGSSQRQDEGSNTNSCSPSSPSSSHYSSSSSNNSSNTPSGGYNELNFRVRSVLQQPVGLPLVCFLNDSEDDGFDDDVDDDDDAGTRKTGARAKRSTSETTKVGSHPPASVAATTTRTHLARLYSQEVADLVFNKDSRVFDAAFSDAYQRWNSGLHVDPTVHQHGTGQAETSTTGAAEGTATAKEKGANPTESQLAKLLSESLIEAVPRDSKVKVKHQFPVQYHHVKPPGNIDLVLYQEHRSLLLAAQFGIGCPMGGWWKKAHQNARHVKGLVEYGESLKEATHCAFADPMLFAVVELELDESNVFASALLGVFLCWPATASQGSPDYRVALLWRTAPTSVDELSAAFGRTVRAATLLPKLLHLITVSGIDRFETLGPNCCRIKDKVRGFQNVRTTVRRCPTSSHFVFTIERTHLGSSRSCGRTTAGSARRLAARTCTTSTS
jgi:hypothetical protein